MDSSAAPNRADNENWHNNEGGLGAPHKKETAAFKRKAALSLEMVEAVSVLELKHQEEISALRSEMAEAASTLGALRLEMVKDVSAFRLKHQEEINVLRSEMAEAVSTLGTLRLEMVKNVSALELKHQEEITALRLERAGVFFSAVEEDFTAREGSSQFSRHLSNHTGSWQSHSSGHIVAYKHACFVPAPNGKCSDLAKAYDPYLQFRIAKALEQLQESEQIFYETCWTICEGSLGMMVRFAVKASAAESLFACLQTLVGSVPSVGEWRGATTLPEVLQRPNITAYNIRGDLGELPYVSCMANVEEETRETCSKLFEGKSTASTSPCHFVGER